MSAPQDHGTYKSYSQGCRCADCREANRLYAAAARARRAVDPALANAAGHGKETTYNNYSCRCAPCRAAHAAHMRGHRARKSGSR